MSNRNHRETTESEDVRNWADERGVVPVRREDTGDLAFVRQEELESDQSSSELTWEEFDDEFDRQDRTFRYEDDDPTEGETGYYEFTEGRESSDRDRDGDRLDTEERIEEGDVLEKGESARTEVTETRTVEKEVVERATVETEVVDEEVISEEVIDSEVLERELTGCSLDDGMREDGTGGYIEADLRERKRFRTEIRERDLIESRVTDVDADETDTIDPGGDSGAVDREISTEGDRDLIDDETVEHEVEAADIEEREESDVDAELIDSETEYDERIERRIVETEVVERYHVRAAIEDRDRFEKEVVSEEITDAELLDDSEVTDDESAETATAGGDFTRSASESDSRGREDAEILGDHDDDDSTRGESADGDTTGGTVHVDDSHEGEEVVGADGETIGIVTSVEDDTISIDPDPGLADRLASDLGMGGADEDDATIHQNRIESIDDDEIRLSRGAEEELEEE